MKCEPGDLVLDYCAGAGGKSLAFGPFLKGKGQLILHDARETALIKARTRFQRSGIQNVQFHKEKSSLNGFKGKIDWLVLDVPCTGISLSFIEKTEVFLYRNWDFEEESGFKMEVFIRNFGKNDDFTGGNFEIFFEIPQKKWENSIYYMQPASTGTSFTIYIYLKNLKLGEYSSD